MSHRRWTELFRSLPPPARLAALGALAVPGSMLFPWYGIEFSSGLSQTGFDSFGLGQLALLLTVGAALYLIVRCAGAMSCHARCARGACSPWQEGGRPSWSAT